MSLHSENARVGEGEESITVPTRLRAKVSFKGYTEQLYLSYNTILKKTKLYVLICKTAVIFTYSIT